MPKPPDPPPPPRTPVAEAKARRLNAVKNSYTTASYRSFGDAELDFDWLLAEVDEAWAALRAIQVLAKQEPQNADAARARLGEIAERASRW